MEIINRQLVKYIESNILSEYYNFDEGHDINHARNVIERSFQIAKYNKLNINNDMAFCVAAYHDYGIKIAREDHALHSGASLRNDSNLKRWFSSEQIEIMANAVEDHSTSCKNPPRNNYGKLVSDADKDINLGNKQSLQRALMYSIFHNPNYSVEEHCNNCYQQIQDRFGEDGLVKFYFPFPKNEQYLRDKRALCDNKKLFQNIILEIYSDIEKSSGRKPNPKKSKLASQNRTNQKSKTFD